MADDTQGTNPVSASPGGDLAAGPSIAFGVLRYLALGSVRLITKEGLLPRRMCGHMVVQDRPASRLSPPGKDSKNNLAGLRGEDLSNAIDYVHTSEASSVAMNLCDQREAVKPGESCRKRISRMDWLSTAIVHDLRNPLGTVFAGAEMLMQLDASPTQIRRLASNIYRAAGRMRELLTDLTGGGNKSDYESCEIRDVIGAASEAASPAAEEQGVRILHDVSGGIEIQLARFRMERVFFNLIANALEAMPHGGEIRIGAKRADNTVLIVVEDTGPGIPRAIRDRLFEPFVTAGKDGGLGLGLALSRQTVLDHGGDMWTEPASGARFIVRLPLGSFERDAP